MQSVQSNQNSHVACIERGFLCELHLEMCEPHRFYVIILLEKFPPTMTLKLGLLTHPKCSRYCMEQVAWQNLSVEMESVSCYTPGEGPTLPPSLYMSIEWPTIQYNSHKSCLLWGWL